MAQTTTGMELWRRIILLSGVLLGIALFSSDMPNLMATLILLIGLLLYIFLPRRKKSADDISYSLGSMIAGDFAALILLVTFYGIPFLVNGGIGGLFTYLWPVTVIMWALALLPIMLFYYNAWHASFYIELSPASMYIISFKGVKTYHFKEISAVNNVLLRNPHWFRLLFKIVALLAILGGRSSTQPAGSALLAESAAYGGLEIIKAGEKPAYIWFTSQNGGVIINNFDRVLGALRKAGLTTNDTSQVIEGFAVFM